MAADVPVLIFGAPRSGTSLLSRLIDAHSRISVPFESHLFNQWLPRLEAYGDLSDQVCQERLVRDIIRLGVVRDWDPRPDPVEVMELVRGPGFGPIARAVMEWAARKAGKPRWGEKTPHHTLLHQEVLAAWPDAQVVMIERDPRAVALSWKEARFHGNHVLPFAKAWVRHAQAFDEIEQSLPPDRRIKITYEALVRDPEGQLERLMTFLGEEFEPKQLEFHRQGADYRTDKRNLARLKTPISVSGVDRWQTDLSDHEIRLVETICGEAMVARGYELTRCNAKPMSDVRITFARYVEYPVQRFLGAFKNARGFIFLGRDLQWKIENMLADLSLRMHVKKRY
ncbi:MAG TPA: sulfotransferase [Rhodothermales bacterium]|nr:sulfotransferase [Rhodothermales bacterium]